MQAYREHLLPLAFTPIWSELQFKATGVFFCFMLTCHCYCSIFFCNYWSLLKGNIFVSLELGSRENENKADKDVKIHFCKCILYRHLLKHVNSFILLILIYQLKSHISKAVNPFLINNNTVAHFNLILTQKNHVNNWQIFQEFLHLISFSFKNKVVQEWFLVIGNQFICFVSPTTFSI